ncbi:hypothetical protein ADM98_11675 [Exiguobacterium sp. BMC-KP]|uniref:hypothetical protein n=1 Tax=Exiguobacterium sp. BMC-KP TaxID=1684312 RepID=UPI0006AA32CE|nr:hypothetical protein [Exiguobacterium sp. BMC-KP]KOP29519.1 hypothetical protein ADM98_11675 [Exiguobacterium sp. BMC-KP]
MEERRRSNRRKSGLGGKGTLFAILGVVVIGTAGGIYSNQNEKPIDTKQEVKAQDEKSESSTKQFKTSVKVQSPSDITDPEKIQAALDAGPDSLKDTIDATDQFVDRLMTKQEAVRKAKKLPIKDFQQTITKDVVQQIDDQITSLNEASQTAHTMAMGLLLNQEKGATFENTEGLDYQNLEQLSQNLSAMASSFETYAMAKNFESWDEASSYLPNRRDKSLLAVPLNEAITKTVESNFEPIIAEPVTEEGNTDEELDTSPEQTDAERYPEAITSVFKISEAMNAIYTTADELQQRFTPYKKEDGFSQFEYISVEDLDDLYRFDATVSNEITASIHFKAPVYTTDGFTQAMDSHRIIIKELDQLSTLLEVYPSKFRQDPGGTLTKAKSHLERIKTAAQIERPGFAKFFKTAGSEAN